MRDLDQADRNGASRTRTFAVLAAVGCALATLPSEQFPPAWLAVFSVPAVVMTRVLRWTRLRQIDAAALGLLLQVVAIVVGYRLVGPLDQLAALGCTLLPPLAWMAARDEDLDALRALFLSFCVFLIGTILGEASSWLVVGFLTANVVALQADSSSSGYEERAAFRGPRPTHWSNWRARIGLVGASLLVCLLLFQLLQAVPSPTREPWHSHGSESGAHGRARVGLDDDFELDETGGRLLDLRADELLRVRPTDGRALPRDLYLRHAQFDVPNLGGWSFRPRALVDAPGRTWRLRRAHDDFIDRELQILLVEPREVFAYVPAGTFEIDGANGMVGDPANSVFRYPSTPPDQTTYRIRYQNLHHLEPESAVEAMSTGPGLLSLPAGFSRWSPLFRTLIDTPTARRAGNPLQLAQAIADTLAERCRYDLRGPQGPHPHAILNFLDGDHLGFCMHFASATAIALRMAGVPCRIGVGLYGGEEAEEAEDAPQVLKFGSHHAHAWVEIPLRDVGWVVFDPTPPAARSSRLWPDPDQLAEPPERVTLRDESDSLFSNPLAVFSNPGRFTWLWLGVAVLAVGALGLRRRGPTVGDPRGAALRGESKNAHRLLLRLLEHFARAGHPRQPHESLERWFERTTRTASAEVLPDPRSLRDALLAYQEVRFGGQPFDAARRRLMEHAILAIDGP